MTNDGKVKAKIASFLFALFNQVELVVITEVTIAMIAAKTDINVIAWLVIVLSVSENLFSNCFVKSGKLLL